MGRDEVSYKISGLPRWRDLVDARTFAKKLEVNIDRATEANARTGLSRVQAALKRGGWKKNADLTIAIKGHDLPLMDQLDLYRSIKVIQTGPMEYFIGVPSSNRTAAAVAAFVHEGALIPVTQKMRMMFYALYSVSELGADPGILTGRARELYSRYQGPWYPLNAETEFIKIPGRPFIDKPLNRHSFRKLCAKRWTEATYAALIGKLYRKPRGEAIVNVSPDSGGGNESRGD